MKQMFILLLFLGIAPSMFPAVPAATTAAVALPAEQAAMVALNANQFREFFDEYRRLTGNAARVRVLNALFQKDPVLGDEKKHLVQILSGLYRENAYDLLGQLDMPLPWHKYLGENESNETVSLQRPIDAALEHIQSCQKEREAVEDRQATEWLQHVTAIRETLDAQVHPVIPACHANVHPFTVAKAMEGIFQKRKEEEISWPPRSYVLVSAFRKNRHPYSFRRLVAARLGYFSNPDLKTPSDFDFGRWLACLGLDPQEHRLVQRCAGLNALEAERVDLNISDYTAQLKAVSDHIQSVPDINMPNVVSSIIVGYIVPYLLGRPQSHLGHGSRVISRAGSIRKDVRCGPTVRVSFVSSNCLIDRIDRKTDKPEYVVKILLGMNLITRVPAEMCAGMCNLTEVQLFDNFIEEIDEHAFDGAVQLQKLNLENNCLTDYPAAIERLPALLEFSLEDNPLTSEAQARYVAFKKVLAKRRKLQVEALAGL